MEIADFHPADIATIYRDLGRRHGSSEKPFVVVNMVSSLDGKASVGGTVGQLGSDVDRVLMREIRAGCDALAYGAGTLRAENVNPRVPPEIERWRAERGMRPQPLRVLFSASGQIPWDNLFFRVAGDPAVIFTSSPSIVLPEERSSVIVRQLGVAPVDLRRGLAILGREHGVSSVVVEGGPVLNYSLLAAGLVDELLLTVAPKIVGGWPAKSIVEGPALAEAARPDLELLAVYRHNNELFLRYRLVKPNTPGTHLALSL